MYLNLNLKLIEMKKIFRLLLFALLCVVSVQGVESKGRNVNVICILVDDLGYGDLSCYSADSPVKTVNIDNLAESGVRMTRAYGYSTSGASRAALVTGKFAHNIGVYNNLDAANPGVGQHRKSIFPYVQECGYTTAWIGKWDQGWDISNHPMSNGFDSFFGFLGSTHNYVVANEGSHRYSGDYSSLGYMLDGYRVANEIQHLTTEFTNRAIDFIDGCSEAKEPFYLTLAYNAPHRPYQDPSNLSAKYREAGLSKSDVARCALIEDLDNNVGRLMSYLKKSRLDKNTLIIFASDNGGEKQAYNGGLTGAKNSVWEGGIRVPMIASMQGVIPANRTSKSMCSIVDIPATVLADKIREEDEIDGVDLMPYFVGEKVGNVHDELLFINNVSAVPYTTPAPQYVNCVALLKGDYKIMIEGVKKFASLYNIAENDVESVESEIAQREPELLIELTDVMYDRLSRSQPACAAIAKIDFRKYGDIFKADSIRRNCLKLMKKIEIEER